MTKKQQPKAKEPKVMIEFTAAEVLRLIGILAWQRASRLSRKRTALEESIIQKCWKSKIS